MYFVIRKNQDGKFWWRAVGDNNEIMASSQLMKSKKSCEESIDVIRDEAGGAKIYDKTGKVTER